MIAIPLSFRMAIINQSLSPVGNTALYSGMISTFLKIVKLSHYRNRWFTVNRHVIAVQVDTSSCRTGTSQFKMSSLDFLLRHIQIQRIDIFLCIQRDEKNNMKSVNNTFIYKITNDK